MSLKETLRSSVVTKNTVWKTYVDSKLKIPRLRKINLNSALRIWNVNFARLNQPGRMPKPVSNSLTHNGATTCLHFSKKLKRMPVRVKVSNREDCSSS
jgi:predicted DNA-binding ribbon-helix-helix protein